MPADPMPSRPCDNTSKPDQRLGRNRRLHTSNAINEAFDGGIRFAGQCMVIWLRRADDANLRVAVVASRRTFRRAVDRNRAKRLLREVFRRYRDRFHGRVDLVLVARKAVLDATFAGIENDLMRLADKARLTGTRNPAAQTAQNQPHSPRESA